MNEHAIANVYLDLSFLLRIMFVKNILSQISFCALTLQVNVSIFSTKFEGRCKYTVTQRILYRDLFKQNGMDFVTGINFFCKTPVVDENRLVFRG